MTRRPRKTTAERGSTLLGQLVAVAVVAVIAVSMMHTLGNAKISARQIEGRQELTFLKGAILNGLNCQNTLAPYGGAPCASLPPLQLRSHGNRPLFPGGVAGRWTMSARCTGNEIVVGATRPASPASPEQTVTDIFMGLSNLCRDELSGAAGDGWVNVACVTIPGASATEQYCASGDHPSELCRHAGYDGAVGTCRGIRDAGLGPGPAQGGLFVTANPGGGWRLSCIWGIPHYGVPTGIRCENY